MSFRSSLLPIAVTFVLLGEEESALLACLHACTCVLGARARACWGKEVWGVGVDMSVGVCTCMRGSRCGCARALVLRNTKCSTEYPDYNAQKVAPRFSHASQI